MTALATTCPPPPPLPTVVRASADVFVATFDKERAQPPFTIVEATLGDVYAGCGATGEAVEIWFSAEPPAYVVGRSYLVSTSEVVGIQRTWSCGLLLDDVFVTADERAFLASRPIDCEGTVACQDASTPSECPDTCADVTCPDATCDVNPCAACALEQFQADGSAVGDADGDLVCDPADVCVGTDDRADRDGDTVCDALDACPGSDDRQDADADLVPDGCEEPLDTGDGTETPPPKPSGGDEKGRCDTGGTGLGPWALALFALRRRR